MFDIDGHVVLDIILIRFSYAHRPAASRAHLRVIAEAAARGRRSRTPSLPALSG
jgi:hypothetical protein